MTSARVGRRPRFALLVSARRVAAGLLFGAVVTAFSAATRSSEPHPEMPRPGLGADEERARGIAHVNDACVGCHAEIADEWRSSHHAQAFTNPAFQRALADEPLAFCRGCHAPEAPPESTPEATSKPALAAIGVACTTCHLAGESIAAPPRDHASAAPHPAARAAAFASPAACAGCHEFDFPDSPRRAAPEKMQSTIGEHSASAYSEIACAGCHMPFLGEGAARHRSHAFASSRADAPRRAALSIEANRNGNRVTMAIGAAEVGHAFPTGDLFRRLAVTAEVVGADGALIASRTRYLARHFEPIRQADGQRARATAVDDRPGAPALGGAPVIIDFDFGEAARGLPIAARVVYQRAASVNDGQDARAVVESESLVFERRLEDRNEPSP